MAFTATNKVPVLCYSFGLTRSYAHKVSTQRYTHVESHRASGATPHSARPSKDQAGSPGGPLFGDAGGEMMSFREIYLFVGEPRSYLPIPCFINNFHSDQAVLLRGIDAQMAARNVEL